MPITLTNPAGLWALLAIPAILLIHFLQRQSIVLPVSTLFLLEKLERESVSGRNFDRIKNSIPLWLQLLIALILTWILIAPRWEKSDSIQRVAIVIDSSASMRAFSDDAALALQREVPEMLASTSRVELTLLESHDTGGTVYHGTNLQEMLDAIVDWKPAETAHDPGAALRIGRSLVGESGILVFLTDHKSITIGYGAKLLAVGSPIENVGFAGISVGEETGKPRWRAIVRNYGSKPAERKWVLAAGGRKTEPRQISLAPGQAVTLEGRFPPDTKRIRLQMEPDDFDLDDQLPVIAPQPKALSISKIDSAGLSGTFDDVLATLENTAPPASDTIPDITFFPYNPVSPTRHETTGIVMIDQGDIPRNFQQGPIIATNHALVQGLNWQGLIARDSPSIPFFETDVPLVWQGDHPLVFLRQDESEKVLHFNFDIPSSNADRLPAFIVLIHRFIEDIRSEKIAKKARNFELSQQVRVAHTIGEGAPSLTFQSPSETREIPLGRTRFLRAGNEPGFFTILQGEDTLLLGASHFADTREADFSAAGSFSDLGKLPDAVVEKQTAPDPLWQLWLILALVALLLAWFYQNRPTPQTTAKV